MALRCIIVDDSPAFLRAARVLLSREGVDVVAVASTSREALECVEKLHPDVALVDVSLGDESGFELADRLAEASWAAPEVILVSTHEREDLDDLIAGSRVAGFLSKPELSADAIRATLGSRAGDAAE